MMRKLTNGRLPSDAVFLAGGLIVVVILVIILAGEPSSDPRRPTNLQSTRGDGTLALSLWLEEIGYETITRSSVDLELLDVVFALEPDNFYTMEQAEALSRWVAAGNTLIAAGTGFAIDNLLAPYDINLLDWRSDKSLLLTSPALSDPPFNTIAANGAAVTFDSDRTDLAVHLVTETGEPVLASLFYGRGMIWMMGTVYPFTNEGLQTEANARLILNLLGDVPDHAVIGFDEVLRLPVEQSTGGLTEWLLTTYAGWSILAAAALVLLFLLLRGRRFGQAIPLANDQLRRESVEFIIAMANLMRRSGNRKEALAYYRDELRRVLAHRYAVDPHRPIAEIVEMVAMSDPNVDTTALARLLEATQRDSVTEHEMVQLALDVHQWIGDRD